MSRRIFEDRERAFEYEFFHRVDLQLLAELRAKIDRDERCEGLQKTTGIGDQAVLDELVELGLTAETILALSLFPLVYVAWSDNDVDAREASTILEAAESVCYGRDSAAYHLLETWLDDRPCDRVFGVWKEYIQAVFRSLTPVSMEALRRDVLSRSRAVASAAGGVLGLHRVSPPEERALGELSSAMDAKEKV